jgi:hypothetical protein
LRADADSVGLVSNTLVANIDIVIARGEVQTSFKAYCDITAAGGVAKERIKAVGRV